MTTDRARVKSPGSVQWRQVVRAGMAALVVPVIVVGTHWLVTKNLDLNALISIGDREAVRWILYWHEEKATQASEYILLTELPSKGNALEWELIQEEYPPTMVALRSGHEGICRDLIRANAAIDFTWVDGLDNNVLHMLAHGGRGAALVGKVPSAIVSNPNFIGDTPLHVAVRLGRRDIVQYLLSEGADADATDIDERTPLHVAVLYGRPEIVELLLSYGADSSTYDRNAIYPLGWAILKDQKACANVLLSHPNSSPEKLLQTPWFTEVEGAFLFLGSRPVHWAAMAGDTAMASIVLDHAPDPVALDEEGWTPLHYAATNSKAVVSFLISRGCDISARTNNDMTSLHIAASSGKNEIVAFLLDQGVPVNARMTDDHESSLLGRTALDLAKAKGHFKTVEILKEHGAKTAAELQAEQKDAE